MRNKNLNIPDSIIWAMETEALSCAAVKLNGLDREEVWDAYIEIFEKNWKEAEEKTIREVDVPYEEDGYYPSIEEGVTSLQSITEIDDGLLMHFDPILIEYCSGDFCEVAIPCDAVEKSFCNLKEKYPGIEYEAIFAFPWSDRRCGDTENFCIQSDGETGIDVDRYLFEKILEAHSLGDFDADLAEEIDGMEPDEVRSIIDFFRYGKEQGYLPEEKVREILDGIIQELYEEGYFDGDDEDAMEIEEILKNS